MPRFDAVKILSTIAIVSPLLLVTMCGKVQQGNLGVNSQEQSKPRTDGERITKADFERITPGQGIDEVEFQLGRKGEVLSESTIEGVTSRIITFNNPDFSNLTLYTTNGKVISKSQLNLK